MHPQIRHIRNVSHTSTNLHFLRNLPPACEPSYWQAPSGRLLAWNEYGDPVGRPLIYVHGWPSSRLQGRLVHHLARERGLRVLAPDRPGIGRSTHHPGRRLESWPQLIADFADSLGISRFAQLGVSGGGPYVLACAAMLGDRVTASAVLCGAVPLAGADQRGLHPAYRMLLPLRRLPKCWFTPPLWIAARVTTGDPCKPPVSWILACLAAEDRALLKENPDVLRVLEESFREGVRQGGRGVMDDAEIYCHPWSLPLEEIQAPIRYWHGGHDRNISVEMVRAFSAHIPAARLDVDPEEGHFSLAIHRARDAMDHLAAA